MNITNQSTAVPNFKMQIKGLDNKYFQNVPKKLKADLLERAEIANRDFAIEFVPTIDNWVFLRKIKDGISTIVDYFPNQYTPAEIVKTFTKAYIPEHRIMAKSLVKESNKAEALKYFSEHSMI